jgi:uncharacterized protein YdeI (YjbR/CyaY-like superfamily)
VARLTDTVQAYVDEAIDAEEAGLEVGPAAELPMIEELQTCLDRDLAFKAAFESLTPGRQREYDLYFSSSKQARTSEARVDKYPQRILDGKGYRDRRSAEVQVRRRA